MKQRLFMLLGLVGALLLTTGCHTLFSSSQSITVSRWNNYDDVEAAFGKITPYQTTVADLQKLGFDPKILPNVKILTYVDIVQTFLPNAGIHKEDLPAAVRECIEAKEKSRAYLVDLQNLVNRRHGNLVLDMFGFRRESHGSGWQFKGMILINTDLVVYKLSSGEPLVSFEENKIKPLGPFQELDTSVMGAVKFVK
jgi:hypothetical protein